MEEEIGDGKYHKDTEKTWHLVGPRVDCAGEGYFLSK